MICPECGTTRVHRSRRIGLYERFVLGNVGVYPYRCSSCKYRFLRHKDPWKSGSRTFWTDPPPWLTAFLWGIVATVIAIIIVGVVAFREASQ